jgi:hypothetical protein
MACPPNYEQLDGSWAESDNCGLAATVDLIMFEHRCSDPGNTRGQWPPTAGRLRTLSGDYQGGTNLAQHDSVATTYYACNLDVRYRLPWSDFIGWLDEGYMVSLSLSYSHITYPFKGDPNFYGNHQVAVLGGREWIDDLACRLVYDPLYDGRRPGIPNGPTYVPERMLRAAAGALLIGSYRLRDRYPGTCYAAANPTPHGATTAPAPPASGIKYGANRMIVMGGLTVSSAHRMSLKQGQPIYRVPSAHTEYIVARMSRDANVMYTGVPADGWRTVIVSTRNFPDGVLRPIQAYVPKGAGPIYKVA